MLNFIFNFFHLELYHKNQVHGSDHSDIIILYMYTKNHAHMMYGSWDKGATDLIFCHFVPFFTFLSHYWPQKLKFRKM